MRPDSNKRNLAKLPKTAATLLLGFSLALSGCGKGSGKNVAIDGVDGPHVNFIDNKLTMTVVLKNVGLDFGTRIKIPNFPNSYLEVGPDFQSNGYLLAIGIDSKDLQKMVGGGAELLDPTLLPGGRPLPGVIDGRLPGMALYAPKLANLTLYLGPAVLGVFVPVKLPLKEHIATFRFYDGAGLQVGNVSVVGQDTTGANSGFLLLINLKGRVEKISGLRLAAR